jgi:hypothetical protein
VRAEERKRWLLTVPQAAALAVVLPAAGVRPGRASSAVTALLSVAGPPTGPARAATARGGVEVALLGSAGSDGRRRQLADGRQGGAAVGRVRAAPHALAAAGPPARAGAGPAGGAGEQVVAPVVVPSQAEADDRVVGVEVRHTS